MTSYLAPAIAARQRNSPLGRTSPLVKLGLAVLWLLGLGLTVDPVPPLVLMAITLGAGLALGAIPPARLATRLLPLVAAGAGIALTNLIFSGQNADPAATELARIGPLRITAEALLAAFGIGARIGAIVAVGAVFALTTDPTRLVDALVQQARLSPRFAYGALAAYQAVPGLADDLATLRAARRLRGLREWHPRILVGLLVRAIRRADQLALAMDARGFGSPTIGDRTTFRPIPWSLVDAVVLAAGVSLIVGLLVLTS
ncbi:MAG TPA: energy-coupling factor transporter transmembrane component T [Candidatus Deferrimicrobiaceae bacterium]|nr:energy-coupling factor transporter transmembrane component T [Candidatus Deferrimicrobiaceae bacterium]